MKILLTGGTGYVGRSLRDRLKEHGHAVRLLVREESAHKVARGAEFEIATGDVLDPHTCMRAMDGCDVVINLVGIIREYPEDGVTYETFHSAATYNVVDSARRMGIERFIQMSALGAKPDSPSRYHRTKFEAEEMVRNSGTRWTVFRPSVIFSPGDSFTRELVDLVHRRVVPIIDGGKALLQPVSLDNVVGPMASSLRMPATYGKIFDACGPDRVSFYDLVNKIAAHYQLRMNTMKVSAAFMRPVVKMLQRYKSFPLTVDQLAMLIEDNVCDNNEYKKTFGIAEMDSFHAALPSLLEAA